MNIDNTCFGFIGLGLIGGSIAKSIKQLCPTAKIIAYNRTYTILKNAQAEGIVDIICENVDEQFSSCDYIFLCMPVSYNIQYLNPLSKLIKKDCILTDVGSVKTDIHRHVSILGLEQNFIGGHPMAGSDKTGYEHATDHLLRDSYYIITPTSQTSQSAIDNYSDFVRQIGAIPMILDFEEHDFMTANISHVPHIIAAGLVNMVRDTDNEKQSMKAIAAGGFKDLTRIASSSPVMWQQICATNSEHICQVLDHYIAILSHFRKLVASHSSDEILQFFDAAKSYRKEFTN